MRDMALAVGTTAPTRPGARALFSFTLALVIVVAGMFLFWAVVSSAPVPPAPAGIPSVFLPH